MSMRELLEDAAATPSEPLDVTEVWEAGRRRRVRARLGTGVAVVVVVGAVLTAGVSVLAGRTTVGIQPAGPGAEPSQAQGPAPGPTQDSSDEADQEPFDAAIERLIAANRSAEDPPAFVDGRTRVTRTLGVWASTTVVNDTWETHLELSDRVFTQNTEGDTTLLSEHVRDDLEVGTTADELRRLAAETDLSASPDGEPDRWLADYVIDVDEVLEEADSHARSDDGREPDPQATERPSDVQAFTVVADALRETVPTPVQRIRALEIIASLDRSMVEYRDAVRDLLGREGIGFAVIDPQDHVRHTLIFDPDSGELLGEMQEALRSPWNGMEIDPPTTVNLSAIVRAEITDETP